MAALAGCPNKTATVSEARDDSACQAQKAGSQALICPPSRPPLSAGFAPRGCHLCCRPRRRRMKIICAGAPKTGTTSLAAALRFLGLTVYDSPEQMAFQLEDWDDILRKGGEPDWRAMFNDVDAICDGPAFYFWEQMLDAFPDAVVILLTRDEDKWAESYRLQKEVENQFRWLSRLSPELRRIYAVADASERLSMGSEVFSPFIYKWKFRLHNERVRSRIRKDRLLEFDVSQGWAPLCAFLGVQPPEDVPFPQCNTNAQELRDALHAESRNILKSACLDSVLVGTVLGALAYTLFKLRA
eukprot:jgi/Tetstr1/438233/TSEL_002885.t1